MHEIQKLGIALILALGYATPIEVSAAEARQGDTEGRQLLRAVIRVSKTWAPQVLEVPAGDLPRLEAAIADIAGSDEMFELLELASSLDESTPDPEEVDRTQQNFAMAFAKLQPVNQRRLSPLLEPAIRTWHALQFAQQHRPEGMQVNEAATESNFDIGERLEAVLWTPDYPAPFRRRIRTIAEAFVCALVWPSLPEGPHRDVFARLWVERATATAKTCETACCVFFDARQSFPEVSDDEVERLQTELLAIEQWKNATSAFVDHLEGEQGLAV